MNKEDFPILKNRVINGHPLVYLDNAATSQMPKQVMDAITDFEFNHRANVHRGNHTLSMEATHMFEDARKVVADFIGAVIVEEVVFVKSATEALNIAARSWGKHNLKKGDVILVSETEHHSNLVPWQKLCEEIGTVLTNIPIDQNGFLDIKSVKVDWTKVRLVSLNHVSNVFGVVNDIKGIVKYIRKRVVEANKIKDKKLIAGVMPKVVLDASQSVPHMKISAQKLGVDFIAFSAHKMCGPMGIGVLWVNRDVFDGLLPDSTGGGMIDVVKFESTTFAKMPELLEAGTPNVSGAIGLAAAIKYLESVGLENISKYEKDLVNYFFEKISGRDDILICGSNDSTSKTGVVTFNLKGISAHDTAIALDSVGVAVRSGHHCVMPWHVKQEGFSTTVRASFYFYNTKEDVDALIEGLNKVYKIFGKSNGR